MGRAARGRGRFRYPGLYPYFDPLEYPLQVLQRFTAFTSKGRKALQTLDFLCCILQHFHPLVKFESLHLRHVGARSAPLKIGRSLTGAPDFSHRPLASFPTRTRFAGLRVGFARYLERVLFIKAKRRRQAVCKSTAVAVQELLSTAGKPGVDKNPRPLFRGRGFLSMYLIPPQWPRWGSWQRRRRSPHRRRRR